MPCYGGCKRVFMAGTGLNNSNDQVWLHISRPAQRWFEYNGRLGWKRWGNPGIMGNGQCHCSQVANCERDWRRAQSQVWKGERCGFATGSNSSNAKLIKQNYHPLEVGGRDIQVGEKYSYLFNLRPNISQSCCLTL